MGFVAIKKSTGERVDLTQLKNPRSHDIKSGDCICQLCGERMIIRAGFVREAHFAHYAQTECRTDYEYHPESRLHLAGKRFVADKLREGIAEYSGATIEFEVKVPEAHRVADIMVTFPMGWREAHEIQLASISIEKLQERTYAYLGEGIDVVWWLGKSAATESNQLWCAKNLGYCFILNAALSDEFYGETEQDTRVKQYSSKGYRYDLV